MLMVVLGAGASFDAVNPAVMSYDEQWRPPLAAGLFEDRPVFNTILLDRVPEAVPIVQHLRERLSYGATMEVELAALIGQAERYPALTVELTALRFYIQEVIYRCSATLARVGMTNQMSLVRQLDIWSRKRNEMVLYVTFNYDFLIEDAFRRAIGIHINTFNDYVVGDRARLFKLHGSVDWWHEVDNRPLFDDELPRMHVVPIEKTAKSSQKLHRVDVVAPEEDIDDARRWLIRDAVELQVNSTAFVRGGQPGAVLPVYPDLDYGPGATGHHMLYPAIAIPVEKKVRYECPSKHVDILVERLPAVDRVLFVGWRGLEDGFLALMREHLPPTVQGQIVARTAESGVAMRPRLQEATGIGVWADVTSDGFSSFVASHNVQTLLAS